MQLSLFEPTSEVTLAFTGHRPDKLGGWDEANQLARWVRRRMWAEIVRLRPATIISGYALGVDQWAAQMALHAGVRLIAAVPFKGQESKWPEHKQSYYHKLLNQATEVHVVSQGAYSKRKMDTRNKWMVDNSTVVCAVWNGSDGGTANCYNYALEVARPIIRIDPREFSAAA